MHPASSLKVYIASDHGGFELKKILVTYMKNILGCEVEDMGPYEYREFDDYTDYVEPVCENVVKNNKNRGILICKNGVGESMLANKFKGIRAGLCFNDTHAASAVKDDDINLLALPAMYISNEEAKETVKIFLEAHFSDQERFKRRLEKVADIENRNFK